MATEEARNVISKDSLISNGNLLTLVDGSETALHSHAGGGGGGAFTSRCSVYQNGDQTITTDVLTTLEFDTELFDGDGEWDAANYKFVVGTTGYYQVNCQAYMYNLTAGDVVYLEIAVDDIQVVRNIAYNVGGYPTLPLVSKLLYLVAGEEVKFKVKHNKGSNASVASGIPHTWATIHRVS